MFVVLTPVTLAAAAGAGGGLILGYLAATAGEAAKARVSETPDVDPRGSRNDIPNADEVSIPSSVDEDAPPVSDVDTRGGSDD